MIAGDLIGSPYSSRVIAGDLVGSPYGSRVIAGDLIGSPYSSRVIAGDSPSRPYKMPLQDGIVEARLAFAQRLFELLNPVGESELVDHIFGFVGVGFQVE